jgi:hypothetical protein
VFDETIDSVRPRARPGCSGMVTAISWNSFDVGRDVSGAPSARIVTTGSDAGLLLAPRTRTVASHVTFRSSPASGSSARSAVHAKGQFPLPLAVVKAVQQSRAVVRHLHDQAGVEAVEEDHGRGARKGAEQAASERGADVSPHAETPSAPATER